MNKLKSWVRWTILGVILGGAIALVGYWLLEPQTDSLFLFVLLRMVIGAVVATIAGPLIIKDKYR